MKTHYSCQGKPLGFKIASHKPIPINEEGIIYWHLNNFTPDIPKHKQLMIVRDVFDKFNHRLHPIRIVGTDKKSDAYFQIYFQDSNGIAKDDKGEIINRGEKLSDNVLAVAYPREGTTNDGVILFNESHFWGVKHSEMSRSLPFTLEHEFGHALGLDHTPRKDDIMSASYNPNNKWTEDSENGLFQLFKFARVKYTKATYSSQLLWAWMNKTNGKRLTEPNKKTITVVEMFVGAMLFVNLLYQIMKN